MAILAAMAMEDLNQDRTLVYSLFQKSTKPKEPSHTPADGQIASIPLADTPPNVSGRNEKGDKSQKKIIPSKAPEIPSLPAEVSTVLGQVDAGVLDIDPNDERRKRRRTVSPASKILTCNEVGEKNTITERPRRSGRDSAAIFYGFIPPPEDTRHEYVIEGAEIPQVTPPKRGRPRKNLVDMIENGRETDLIESSNSSRTTQLISSHPPDNQVSGKATKILKFNPRTGTIGSPPAKKAALETKKAVRSKKTKSLIVTIRYGPDLALKSSVGEKIDQIFDGTLTIPFHPKKLLEPPKPLKALTQPPKILHPLFLGKNTLKPDKTSLTKPPPKVPCFIDLTGPIFPKLKFLARPAANFAGFGAPKTVKFPGAVDPAWPWFGMVHVRGIEVDVQDFPPLDTPFASRSRKSKYTATQIPLHEHFLSSVAAELGIENVIKMAREVNLDDYPPLPRCLRVPEKHLESGKRIQQRVRGEVLARVESNADPDDSSEDELHAAKPTRNFVHPALAKHYDAIATTLSAFDNSLSESQSWIHKYCPQSAPEVLQTGSEALILKEWLQTLIVTSVEGALGGSSKAQGKPEASETTGKRKRKAKKLDDFIAPSDDESELGEITEPEEMSLQEDPLVRKTVVRAFNKGKETGKLKNSVLVSGPHGCGKTAAVYAVAKELGFEVFEINSSSRRSGKDILEKVGDMTRNHQVQRQNVLAMPQVDEDKQRIEQALAADLRSGRQGTMNSFFKPKDTIKELKAPKAASLMENSLPAKETPKLPPKEQKQSLILIEEVDVLYEEDKNFWATVMTLIITSKRPIIMTCNDESLVPELSNALHAIIRFSPPPIDLATDHMLLIAACEGHVLRREAVASLYRSRNLDLRASISELNFWCQFGVGDQKHGGDWYHRRCPANDLDSRGHKIRVVSDNTYHAGMGYVSRDFLDSEMTQGVEEEILHQLWDGWNLDAGDWQTHSLIDDWVGSLDASTKVSALAIYENFAECMSLSDLFSASTFAQEKQDEIDNSIPPLKEKVLEDYTLGRRVIQASPVQHFQTLHKDMSIHLKSQARHLLHTNPRSAQAPPRSEKDIINLITNRSTTKLLGRQDLSLAFDPISYAPSSVPSNSLEPSIFDRTITIITLDVAPFVRGIVAYDARLAKERLNKSHFLSEGGNGTSGRKRMRTTRAALSALEGGVRSTTRRERYFGSSLNARLVARTGGEGWYEAVDEETSSTTVGGEEVIEEAVDL